MGKGWMVQRLSIDACKIGLVNARIGKKIRGSIGWMNKGYVKGWIYG